MSFTVDNTKIYEKKGVLLKKLVEFLEGEGNNLKLAEIMKSKGTLHSKKLDFSELIRIAGPEENMKYKIDQRIFEEKINKMVESINKGWEPAPLIVWDTIEGLTIADGSHRIEALRKLGFKSYLCIIWKD